MKTSRCLALSIALLCLVPAAAGAYDSVLHSDVVYAVAVANGFSPEDAALMADASQSLDDNDATTAFSYDLIGRELMAVGSGGNTLDKLPHMISGQIYHALGGDEVRRIVEEGHLKRIAEAKSDIDEVRSPEAKKEKTRRVLVYLGEYLHFLADTVVHPPNPFWGHSIESLVSPILNHDPDRADRDEQKLHIAIGLMSDQLVRYQKDLELAKTPPSTDVRVPNRLHDNPGKNHLLENVAKAVVDSWRNTYPDELQSLLKRPAFKRSTAFEMGMGPSGSEPPTDLKLGARDREAYSSYGELLDRVRKSRAHAEIQRVLKDSGLLIPEHKYYKYQKIDIDQNGEPSGKRYDAVVGARKPHAQSFAKALADNSIVADERFRNATIQTLRATGGVPDIMMLPTNLTSEVLKEARKAAVWRPPSGPGGIALDPELVMPKGLGKPSRITTDGTSLVLEASTGRFVFGRIELRSFATLARTIASGEIPFVTIGSTPSDRPGYARVLYAPSLIGTWEGAALHDADVLFKAIFSRFPFGPYYLFNRPESDLYRAFPGFGGESMRLWITSRRVVLENRDGILVPTEHGMRILSETILDRRCQEDPEMEAYAAKLTADWDAMAERLWPIRAVEDMARATAIVFWARSENVPIDPLIFTLPSRMGFTPVYAPIIGALGKRGFAAAGGVALTPEDKSTASGRHFLNHMRSTLLAESRQEDHSVLVTALLVLSFAALALGFAFVCSMLLWGVCRLVPGLRLSWREALQVWALACLGGFVLAMAFRPLVAEGGALGYFDADLLSFLVTVVAFPGLLFALLHRRGLRQESSSPAGFIESARQAPGVRLLLVAVGQLGPACNAALSLALALATAAMVPLVPSPAWNTLLTYELTPADVWCQGLFSLAAPTTTLERPGEGFQPRFLFVPRSLIYSQRRPFENDASIPSLAPTDITNTSTTKDPNLPFTSLRRISWPANMPLPDHVTHYSPDGNPPFAWGAPDGKVDHVSQSKFETFRVLESPVPSAWQVVYREGDFSETLWIDPEPLLGDSDFVGAELSRIGDSFGISIVLSREGQEKFAKITRASVGKRLAIFLEGRVVSAPKVGSPVTGGVIQIWSRLSESEARKLVDVLNRK